MKITKKMRKIAKGMNYATKAAYNAGEEHRGNMRVCGRTYSDKTPYVNLDNFIFPLLRST